MIKPGVLLLLIAAPVFAHTPGQLNKYYNYYKLAHTVTKRNITSVGTLEARKRGAQVCAKITKKFDGDENYSIACTAGVDDRLNNTLRQKQDLETLLHEIEIPATD